MTRATIIVASYNSRARIAGCLHSALRQKTAQPYEVIVVDSSDDGTDRLIAEEFPSVRLVRLEERTYPGKARNIGVSLARGEIVAFLDAACAAPADWLDAIFRHFARSSRAVGGSRLNAYPRNPAAVVLYLREFYEFLPTSRARNAPFVPAGNSAFKRSMLLACPFPEDLYGCEDVVLGRRIAAAFGRTRFDPRIQVLYFPRATWKKSLEHLREMGYWSAVARRRYAGLGLSPQGRWLPWLLLPLRALRIAAKLDVRLLAAYWRLAPGMLRGLASWTEGYCSVHRKSRGSSPAPRADRDAGAVPASA